MTSFAELFETNARKNSRLLDSSNQTTPEFNFGFTNQIKNVPLSTSSKINMPALDGGYGLNGTYGTDLGNSAAVQTPGGWWTEAWDKISGQFKSTTDNPTGITTNSPLMNMFTAGTAGLSAYTGWQQMKNSKKYADSMIAQNAETLKLQREAADENNRRFSLDFDNAAQTVYRQLMDQNAARLAATGGKQISHKVDIRDSKGNVLT